MRILRCVHEGARGPGRGGLAHVAAAVIRQRSGSERQRASYKGRYGPSCQPLLSLHLCKFGQRCAMRIYARSVCTVCTVWSQNWADQNGRMRRMGPSSWARPSDEPG